MSDVQVNNLCSFIDRKQFLYAASVLLVTANGNDSEVISDPDVTHFPLSVPDDKEEDFDMSFRYGGSYEDLPKEDDDEYKSLVEEIEKVVSTLKLPLWHFLIHQIDANVAPELSCPTAGRPVTVNAACTYTQFLKYTNS